MRISNEVKRGAQGTLAFAAAVLALAWLASVAPARAGTVTDVMTVNTSSFVGSAASFELFATLTDGSGTGDGNNTITLHGFSFGAGGAAGAVDGANTSNATGNLTSGVSLTDSAFASQFAAFFTPGTSLSFTVSDTFTSLDSPTPDEFTFSLIENGAPLATTDPTGSGNLATLTFNAASPAAVVYADTNSADSVGTPSFVAPVSAPEPASLPLLGLGLGAVLLFAARRRRLTAQAGAR